MLAGALAAAAASPVRAQPTAQDDVYSTQAGAPFSVAAPAGVLLNDAGQNLQAVLVSNVSNGILLFNAQGGFFYLPAAGFSGNDSFTYQAVEGSVSSNVATVTISVIPAGGGNVAPVTRADSYTLNEDETLTVAAANGVLANDTDANGNPLTAVLVAGTANGTLTLNADGSFTYTPPPGFSGAASFSYQADDGMARSSPTAVTLTIDAVNDAPAAQPDSYSTAEDTPLTVAANGVLDNDSDEEGGALTAELVRDVADGTLQLASDGSFSYAPPANFSGTTSFTYRARDASLAESAVVTVTIDVTAVNDPPFISSTPPASATEGVTYRYTLTAADPDGTTPTVSAPTLPGWLSFQAPATITGTPDDDDVGTHEVLMSVTDGIAPPVVQRFDVTVAAVDDAPSIKAIPEQTATENTPFDLDLTAFVSDDDTPASSLTYTATAGVPNGLALSAAGRLSGTPEIATSVGTHTVRFTVADGETAVPAQFVLTVLPAGRVDLAVTMSAAPNPVPLDTPTAWTITVTNRAQQVGAQGASLEASFAGEVPFDFDAPPASSGCTLTPSGNRSALACQLGPLAGGASTTITLTGRGSVAGDVLATARVAVAGAALDETTSNDTTTAALSIAQRVTGLPAQHIELAAARAAATGDFNGDGFADLVVATAAAQGVVLFTNVADPANPGRRSFATPPQSLGGEPLAADVAVADLDRDGDLDVVTAAGSGAPNRTFVSSAGVFASAPLGDAALESRAVAVGDVNGDGFPDLVFAAAGTSPVLVNNGSGAAFAAAGGVGPHDARDVLLVDLFGDALPELVVADGGGGAAVYRNAAGAFVLETTLETGPTSAVAAGDFNADGRADLVFARDTATPPGAPSSLVLLNTAVSTASFFAADELGAAHTAALAVRDFNLDSRADVLALNGHGVRLFMDAGAANGTFALHALALATPGARGAAAGEFNNDNRVDLAVVGDGVAVFFNDGAGNFGQPDSNPPVIQLRGEAAVDVTIDSPYADPGATATDPEDGDITSRIVVVSTVDTTVLGTYTVTYSVSDLSGNPAAPVVRTVTVLPQPAASEGGGGALGVGVLALLAAALALRRRAAARSRR